MKKRFLLLVASLLLLTSCGTAAVEPSGASPAETSRVESSIPSEESVQASAEESLSESISSEPTAESTEEPSEESSAEPSVEPSEEPSGELSESVETSPVYSSKISSELIELMENAEEGEMLSIVFHVANNADEEAEAWLQGDASDEELMERFDLTAKDLGSHSTSWRKIYWVLQWEANKDAVLKILDCKSLEEVPAHREVEFTKSANAIWMNMTVEEIHALAERDGIYLIEPQYEMVPEDF